MPEDTTRLRLVAHGRVQGVFFRSSVRDRASEAGVSGWACNRTDGTMEAVLEGPSEAVEGVAEFCAEGPEGARVERLERTVERPQGIAGFRVL